MTPTLDLPTLDRRDDLLPAPELLTQPQPVLPWRWANAGKLEREFDPCTSITMTRGLLASVAPVFPWTYVNIDTGIEDGNPSSPRFVAQVLGNAARNKVMLEVHVPGRYFVVARSGFRGGRWHEFPGQSAEFVARCRPEELLKTTEMLDIAITWLCVGQIPDGYILRSAYPAERVAGYC